jgi:hypothetical protein
MKKLILLIFIPFCFIPIGCKMIQEQRTTDNNKELVELKVFAENYQPSNEKNKGPDKLPEVNERIKDIILNIEEKHYDESEKHLTLIILKLYRSHLECCNQSYELRNNFILNKEEQPILYKYLIITEEIAVEGFIEFIPSSIAYDWVTKKPELLIYEPIKVEFERIRDNIKRIEKGW